VLVSIVLFFGLSNGSIIEYFRLDVGVFLSTKPPTWESHEATKGTYPQLCPTAPIAHDPLGVSMLSGSSTLL